MKGGETEKVWTYNWLSSQISLYRVFSLCWSVHSLVWTQTSPFIWLQQATRFKVLQCWKKLGMSSSDIFLCGHSHDAMCWPPDCTLLLKRAGELSYILPVRKKKRNLYIYVYYMAVGPSQMVNKKRGWEKVLQPLVKTWISEDVTRGHSPAPCSRLWLLFFFRGKSFPVLTHVLGNVTAALFVGGFAGIFLHSLLLNFDGQWLPRNHSCLYQALKTKLFGLWIKKTLFRFLLLLKELFVSTLCTTWSKYFVYTSSWGENPSSYPIFFLMNHLVGPETAHNDLL